ncbi:MAG: hypothetical protein K6G23_08385 [Lachnospiraceae bacterium]|nr:hypothetical protein [Lachnospiraceae bacterium]
MKCKNCGANYRTIKMNCPYCGAENRLGRIWHAEQSEAERAFEEARKEQHRKYSPFILNRWLNRGILIALSMIVLSIVIVLAASLLDSLVPKIRYHRNAEKIEALMESYYQSGDYRMLRTMMDEYDLYGQDRYVYSQACFLYYDYRDFTADKYTVLQDILMGDGISETRLQLALMHARRFCICSLGDYSALAPENEDYYLNCLDEIKAFLVGYLGMTEHEWTDLCDADQFYDEDVITATLMKRRAYLHE